MVRGINLYTVDHHNPPLTQSEGFVRTIQIGKGDALLGNSTFADMMAQYRVWRGGDCITDRPTREIFNYVLHGDIIGFQGYRKHLDFRLRRQVRGDWISLDPVEFRQYQIWQADYAAQNIAFLLQDCDVLTNPPYDVTHNGGLKQDWIKSASIIDWKIMEDILRSHGVRDFDIPTVTSYCVFTGTGKIFDQWMNFWHPVACALIEELPQTCPDPGPRPDIYLPRRLAFLSERVYSLWLHSREIRTKPLPLLVCWELQ
jgi:hypothetical protein